MCIGIYRCIEIYRSIDMYVVHGLNGAELNANKQATETSVCVPD